MTTQNHPAPARAKIPPQSHVKHPEQRFAQGKALREIARRKSQSEWHPPADRADPVELLIENSQGRLEELLPIRYGRMMASPFTFYRGAAAIMAYDLAHTPATGLHIMACGDCHLMNFGGFATAERQIAFDINDFDEGSLAPWEWDIKRLAASFVLAGRSNGFAESACREAAWTAVQSYRLRMAQYAEMPVLQVWYDFFDFNMLAEKAVTKEMRNFYLKKLASATEQSHREKEFARLAFQSGAAPRIIDQPPLIFHYGDERDQIMRAAMKKTLAAYKKTLIPARRILLDRFEPVDYAIKVVGIGSVGTICGIYLLMSGNGEPLFLQFKQARRSVLEPYCGASPFKHAGERVVMAQRTMQAAGDIFLGWTTGAGGADRHFYIRQLSDAKIKPVIEIMKEPNLINYGRFTGAALARAHARSVDAALLTGYLGRSTAFEDAVTNFAAAYADQTERDHAKLLDAIRNGRIEARVE